MESHDEERIMYKNITYGNTSGTQNAKNPLEALQRTEALAVLMLTTPGPKMIWQFGEIGYDISIDFPCRVCNKPILWNYFLENSRKRLYDVYKASIDLRKSHPVFTGDNFTYSLNSAVKSLKLNDPNMNAVVIVNIDVNPQDKTLDFQQNGWWYEYFSGDSIQINGTSIISLDPGEYKVFTDLKLNRPEILNTLELNEYDIANWDVNIFPNPSRDFLNITVNGSQSKDIKYTIMDTFGKIIYQQNGTSKRHKIKIENLSSGNYFLILEQDNYLKSKEFVKF
tara:strand:- start:316 stop:1158 length:843 start_codon:yes stop_codon:yes gene_type:complete